MVEFTITDRDIDCIEKWKNILHDLSMISFQSIEMEEFLRTEDMDAFVMRSIFALDLYRTTAIHGKSLIINTESDRYMPDFVITTPTYLANNSPNAEKWDYSEWTAIFGAINEFNLIHNNKIIRVGLELSFLYGYRQKKNSLEQEAIEFRKAYLDCFDSNGNLL
jgi:hypothetical protein